jgi:hypothetical protein
MSNSPYCWQKYRKTCPKRHFTSVAQNCNSAATKLTFMAIKPCFDSDIYIKRKIDVCRHLSDFSDSTHFQFLRWTPISFRFQHLLFFSIDKITGKAYHFQRADTHTLPTLGDTPIPQNPANNLARKSEATKRKENWSRATNSIWSVDEADASHFQSRVEPSRTGPLLIVKSVRSRGTGPGSGKTWGVINCEELETENNSLYVIMKRRIPAVINAKALPPPE